MTAASIRVTFPGSQGHLLAGRLDLPAGPPRAYALFAHCFTCSKDVFVAGRIAAELNAHGIAVLRIDFTGLGSSGGDFANTNFTSNLEDLRLAAAWLRENRCAPQLLVGHSLGGAAVLAVANDLPETRAVATIGAPADVEHVVSLFTDDLATIARYGDAAVRIAGREFRIAQTMVDDLRSHTLLACVADLRRPLLILHSPIDNVVGIENAARLYAAARHPKSFVSLDGADHLLSAKSDAVYAAQMIATWSARHLVDENPAVPAPAFGAQVVVAETGQGPFLNHVVAGGHQFLTDEPEGVGGFDAGPSPYDLLAAALGACTSMTLRMYADRKRLPVERIVVEVTHDKRHLDDSDAVAAGQGTMIDHFGRLVHVDGPLTEQQRESLQAIANKCPVHRTIERGAVISTSFV